MPAADVRFRWQFAGLGQAAWQYLRCARSPGIAKTALTQPLENLWNLWNLWQRKKTNCLHTPRQTPRGIPEIK